MTQLPASILPASLPGDDASSALARYLRGLLVSSNGNAVSYDLLEPSMEAALALAILSPFDPAERIQSKRHEDETISLLEAVLSLTNSNKCCPHATQWPTDPAQFGPHLFGQSRKVDTEWVAAALTAAGCNPWADLATEPSQIPKSVLLAAQFGLSGLLERFLECPGAWSAQQILDAKITVPAAFTSSQLSLWEDLSTGYMSAPSLEVFMKAGARLPDTATALDILSDATPAAVAVIASFDGLSLSVSDKAKIDTQWKDRCKRHSITPVDVEKMGQGLWGADNKSALSSADVEISRMLSVGWKKASGGSSSKAYDFLTSKGADSLNATSSFKGAVSGKWSLLAAAAFSRIKQADYSGCLGWSVSNMLFREFDHEQKRWEVADSSQPPYLNSLKGALGFDWRPGVSIDGIVALSLFGQRGTNAPTEEKETLADIVSFGQAAGIDDVRGWATSNMPAAVEFTSVALKRGTPDATECFLSAWSTALTREPSLADGLDGSNRLRLVSCIANPRLGMWDSKKKMFQQLTGALFPDLNEKSLFRSPFLDDHQLSAALLLALTSGSGNTEKMMNEVFDLSSRYDQGNMNTIKEWVERKDSSDKPAWQARIAQWELDRSTVAPSSPSSRGPRL